MQRILIADDNDDNLYYLQALLGASGYEVLPARNGAEVLEYALATPPDLVISDILMPVMDGFSLCRRWRSEARLAAIPFVFYTATYTDPKDRELGLSIGADEFLVKPLEPNELLQIVRGLLRQKEEGALPDRSSAATKDDVFLREYNAVLIRKLEDKLRDLDAAYQRVDESERRFRSVVEGAPEGMLVQVDGVFRYLNPAALALFGAETPDQIVGQSFSDRVHPDCRAVVTERLRLMKEERHFVPVIEEQYLRMDGSSFDVEVTAAPFDFEGCPGSIVFVRDITRRKQAERAMQALEGQFRQAQKLEAVGRLAGGIAHDFNNLLMVIRSYTEMLQDRLPAEDGLRRNTQQVMKAADRAASLTQQMLAFSRKQVLSPRVLDLNAVVNETAKMLVRLIGEDIELLVGLADSLWAIRADPDQIVQVLMNLCVNARDAMPEGGTLTLATCNVTVGEDGLENCANIAPGDYVALSVTDNGTGISTDVQEQMFEPFFTTKDTGKGTGLGLSTVYGIVKQSGGFIWVDTELGRGTSFTIYLPREKSASELNWPTQVEQCQQGTETLLVVEDEQALRESMCEFLGGLGYTVHAADSGHQALSTAKERDSGIDLLLTDVVMPKMSGRELSQMLTREYPNLKTIFMSGYTDDTILRHGLGDAGIAFLQKPFSLSTLARKVRQMLGAI